MVYRSSVRNYLAAKYIAVFVGNVLFVLLPFLVNYALCRLLYPVNASNPFGSSLHAEITGSNHAYRTLSSGNPFAALFFENQTVFYLIYLLILCLVSAVLGIFVLSVSVWLRKYRILLFLPVYLILRIGSLITEISFNEAMENHEKIFVNFDLSDYLAPFGMGGTYYPILILFLLLLLLFSAVSYLWFCKKEYLNV